MERYSARQSCAQGTESQPSPSSNARRALAHLRVLGKTIPCRTDKVDGEQVGHW